MCRLRKDICPFSPWRPAGIYLPLSLSTCHLFFSLSLSLCIYLPTYLSSTYLPLTCLSTYLSPIYLSTYPPITYHLCLSICLPIIYLPTSHLPTSLLSYLSLVYLPTYHLPISLFTYLLPITCLSTYHLSIYHLFMFSSAKFSLLT